MTNFSLGLGSVGRTGRSREGFEKREKFEEKCFGICWCLTKHPRVGAWNKHPFVRLGGLWVRNWNRAQCEETVSTPGCLNPSWLDATQRTECGKHLLLRWLPGPHPWNEVQAQLKRQPWSPQMASPVLQRQGARPLTLRSRASVSSAPNKRGRNRIVSHDLASEITWHHFHCAHWWKQFHSKGQDTDSLYGRSKQTLIYCHILKLPSWPWSMNRILINLMYRSFIS